MPLSKGCQKVSKANLPAQPFPRSRSADLLRIGFAFLNHRLASAEAWAGQQTSWWLSCGLLSQFPSNLVTVITGDNEDREPHRTDGDRLLGCYHCFVCLTPVPVSLLHFSVSCFSVHTTAAMCLSGSCPSQAPYSGRESDVWICPFPLSCDLWKPWSLYPVHLCLLQVQMDQSQANQSPSMSGDCSLLPLPIGWTQRAVFRKCDKIHVPWNLAS